MLHRALPPTIQTSLATKSSCSRLRKVVAETFCNKIYMLWVLPTQLPCMAWLPFPRNFIQSEVSIYATCNNLIVARQVWTWVVIKRAMLPNKLRVFVAPCTVVQVTFWCLLVWSGLGGRWGKRSTKTSDEKVSGDPRKNKEIPVLLSRCYVAMSLTFWFVELCGVDWEKLKRVYVRGRSNTNLASRLCHWLKKHHSHILTWPQLLKSWIALSTARINSYPVDEY